MLLNKVGCLPVLSGITPLKHICTKCFRQRQNKSINRQGASTPALFPFFSLALPQGFPAAVLGMCTELLSFTSLMFLKLRRHDEKGLNCLAYLIFSVSVLYSKAKFKMFTVLMSLLWGEIKFIFLAHWFILKFVVPNESKSPYFLPLVVSSALQSAEWKYVCLELTEKSRSPSPPAAE